MKNAEAALFRAVGETGTDSLECRGSVQRPQEWLEGDGPPDVARRAVIDQFIESPKRQFCVPKRRGRTGRKKASLMLPVGGATRLDSVVRALCRAAGGGAIAHPLKSGGQTHARVRQIRDVRERRFERC